MAKNDDLKGYLVKITFTDTKEEITSTLIANREEFIWVQSDYEISAIDNRPVEVIIFDELQGDIYNTGFIEIVLGKLIWIRKRKRAFKQRRSFKRIKINLKGKVKKISSDIAKEALKINPLEIKIINLSENGILFYSKEAYPEGTVLYIDLFLLNKELIDLPAQIVRKEEKPDGFYYGCLLYISNETKEAIRKIIYTKEQALKKKVVSAKEKSPAGSNINFTT